MKNTILKKCRKLSFKELAIDTVFTLVLVAGVNYYQADIYIAFYEMFGDFYVK